jgi:predicted SAM-dependent methyltransferase
VIEHVPNPVETLATMKKLLAPSGIIWISVPNAAYPVSKALKGRWHSSDLPYHLMHFSPQSMAMTGQAAGLNVRHQTTDSMPKAVAASLGQYLRHRWFLPGRITKNAGVLPIVSEWYARRADEKKKGEAIITEFVAA